jgi:hypothetical protein
MIWVRSTRSRSHSRRSSLRYKPGYRATASLSLNVSLWYGRQSERHTEEAQETRRGNTGTVILWESGVQDDRQFPVIRAGCLLSSRLLKNHRRQTFDMMSSYRQHDRHRQKSRSSRSETTKSHQIIKSSKISKSEIRLRQKTGERSEREIESR